MDVRGQSAGASSLHHVGPEDWTHLVCGKGIYMLSHLAGSIFFLNELELQMVVNPLDMGARN